MSFSLIIISALSGCDDSGDIIKNELVTVQGRVVNDFGSPVSGATVASLYGGTQIVTTSSSGAFTLNRLKVPFDLYLVYNGKAVVYKGVKSTSPLLNTFNYVSNYDNYSRISVTIPPIGSNQVASAWFVDTTGLYQGDSSCVGDNHISFSIGWEGVNVLVGRVMVLVHTIDNNNKPLTYDNYGEKTAALVNTGTCSLVFSNGDISLDPGEATLNCQLFVPSGTISVDCSLFIGSKSIYTFYKKGFHLFGSDENTISYSIIVPDSGSRFKYFLETNTTGNGTYSNKVINVQKGNSTVNVDNPSVLLSPQNGTNDINYNSEFSFFSDNSNGLYRTVFSGDSLNPYCVNILSKAPNATIPDLSFLGVVPDFQKNYTWHVLKYSNLNNIDDFVLSNFTFNQLLLSISSSETRTFRFASNPK